MNLFVKLKALYLPLFILLLAIGIIYGLLSFLNSTKGVAYAANNSYSGIKQKGVLGAQIGSYNSQLGGYIEYEYCGSDLNTCTSTRNGNYLSYGQANLHNCFDNQCVIQDIGYGRCGYCVRKPVDCGSLSINQCKDHLDECFVYRGGKGDAQRCQTKQDVGQTCYTGACYSSPGQYCIPGAKTAGPDAGMIGYCGKYQQGLGEPCFENEHCASSYCNKSLDVCENPPATPPTSNESCRTHSDCPANQFCISNVKGQKGSSSCVSTSQGGTNALCEDYASQGLPVNVVCASQKCNTSSLRCDAAAGATPPPASTPPPSSDPNSCTAVGNINGTFACLSSCGVNGDKHTVDYKASGHDNYGNDKCNGGICCYDPDKYAQYYGSSIGGSSSTPAPGGGTTSPGGGTPGPASGPCAGVKGGVLSYVNGTCNEKLFDATKAAAREFCGGVYKDKYICQNIDPSTSQRYVDYVPSGGNTCSSPPWCPATGGTTTPSPTVGPDANCTAYQGQTCHPNDYSNKIYCCEPNKNLECTNPNPLYPNSYTCQYKGGVAFTPTPGASNNCSAANFGNWGVGCACPTGGGCGGTLGCYKEASGKVFPPDNPNGQFCATGRWCAQSQTDVQNTAACMSATPYVSPSPTGSSGGGSGYQADCPYYNAAGGLTNNECQDGTQCLAGYDHAPIGPGGTNGDRVCSETNGRPNVCCTKRPGGSTTTTTPAPGGGTTAPVPSTTTAPAPTSSYTPPSSCVGHPANSMCGSASEANMQCFYPGGTGYWGWKGEGNGCDLGSGTQTNCYVCTP